MNVESRLEDALDAMTHAVMGGTGEAGLRRVARGFDRDEAEPFVPLLLNLRAAYEPVEPSAKFLRQLQEDLIGEPQRGLIGRARSMPPRVQFAAAAVAIVTAVLIALRWLSAALGSRADDETEVATNPK